MKYLKVWRYSRSRHSYNFLFIFICCWILLWNGSLLSAEFSSICYYFYFLYFETFFESWFCIHFHNFKMIKCFSVICLMLLVLTVYQYSRGMVIIISVLISPNSFAKIWHNIVVLPIWTSYGNFINVLPGKHLFRIFFNFWSKILETYFSFAGSS